MTGVKKIRDETSFVAICPLFNFQISQILIGKRTPEEERGKSLYRIRAYSKDLSHSTYVQTRFSGAQTNTGSLALFLAISKKFPSTLKLVILDDPVQSMDSMHKEALATIMDKLATEKQVIIATQDKEFKEQMVRHLPKNSRILLFDKWGTEGPLISKP